MKTSLLLLIAFCAFIGSAKVQGQIVVANHGVKSSEISKNDLRDIFLGASSNYKDGSHAVPVTLKGGPTHEQFLKNYVGKNDGSFRAEWRAVLFAGQGTIPRSFDTEAALIDYIASTPGAIGYVSSSTSHEKVKTLTVK